jgi:hypothetical protein
MEETMMDSKNLKPEEMDMIAGGSALSDMKEFNRLIKQQQKQRKDFEKRRAEMESQAQQRILAAEESIKAQRRALEL